LKLLYIPPSWLKALSGKYLKWQFPSGEKKIFLSFDDGPTPGVTPEIIRILDQHKAKATFFLLGKKAYNHPELVQDIVAHGHNLGNHGWDHIDGWLTRTSTYIKNAEKGRAVIPGNLFRPPFGRITPCQIQALRKKDMEVIMWSVLAPDYAHNSDLTTTLSRVVSKTGDGSIVVFHDSEKARKNCLALLPAFLDHFSGLGFSFEAIRPKHKQS